MKAALVVRLLSVLGIMVLALPAVSQKPLDYEPARFGGANDAIKRALPTPNLSQELPVVGVYCQADVAADGAVGSVICYEKEGFDELRRQTEYAVDGQAFDPATVNGTPVPVRMHFRVVYSNLASQPPVLLLPNLGNMQSKFGHDYYAPQERLDQPRWYQTYRQNDWSEGKAFFSSEDRLVRLIVVVDKAGTPIAVHRIEAPRRYKRDLLEVEKQLKKSRFIPGFADGEPQRMRYIAVLHYPE